ncbi:MAG: polysaccharide biosynthesis C-terminal domain-containing protein, partial [Chitinophagaceae bacterium]
MRPPRFYPSLGLLIALNVIIKPLWIFAIDRQVQNALGDPLYGTYFSLLNLALMGGFLLDWGISAYLNRQMAAREISSNESASDFLYIKLFFAGIFLAVILLLAWFSGTERWDILFPVLAIQALSSFLLFLRGIITAQQWFHADAWISVLDKMVMIFICGSFLYLPAMAGPISIGKFLWTQVGATALAVGVVLRLLQKKGFRFSTGKRSLPAKRLLRQAFPYAMIVLLMTIHYRLDGFLLGQIKSPDEAGLYATAYRLLDAANITGYLAASFLLPFIARRQNAGEPFQESVQDVRHLLMLYSITLVILFFFLGGWFNEVLYHRANPVSTRILQWCMPALIGYSLVQVYGTALTACGHIIPFCYIALGAAGINAVLNIILVPGYGALGCCIAAITSQGIFGIASFMLARKKCGVILHPGSALLYIFIGGILSGSLYGFRLLELNPVLQVGLALLLATGLAMTTGLINIKKFLLQLVLVCLL